MAKAAKQIDPVVEEVTRVYEALTRLAIRECKKVKCYGPDAVVPGTGKTAKDLASDTLVKLYVRGWSPGAGAEDILPLGRVIVKNMFTDLVRSSAFRTTVSLDTEELEKLLDAITDQTPQTLAELSLIVEKMKVRLGEDEWCK